jgi:hypothetical protein
MKLVVGETWGKQKLIYLNLFLCVSAIWLSILNSNTIFIGIQTIKYSKFNIDRIFIIL